ncbi:aldehyde dehydrogenase family protein [Krasilnikoviella flava]|uniref:NADP-dependent aldehyde dehydrogenase n=1 Tax=Krasilnikoviella flava TaxID=526729 RepID=A0A1T5KFU7_9MICO|nr:aldehyde dehydrogenase family protein [Krasilnikoviella flava]SKC62531.1 NADP-dependent aldehyde dehydrogenase [Krasilnikoviella flava]
MTTPTDSPTTTAPAQPEDAARAAAAAAPVLADLSPSTRADALRAVADSLGAHDDELVGLAAGETRLAEARLRGELKRTRVQLRLFARVVESGAYLDVRLDAADPDFVLGPRPDLRRTLWPVGPVLVFAASNFPFAFSVPGGDTAAALAAGCPVIVKAHPGHPALSRRVADLMVEALAGAGLPAGTFALVEGDDAGRALLAHPAVRAAAFTGSTRVGRLLADAAAARPDPIPFFGELGSLNPVLVTPDAFAERGAEIARAWVGSVSGSAGQLCTKPGFLLVPEGHGLGPVVADAAAAVPEHALLNARVGVGYVAGRSVVLGTPGVAVLAAGSAETEDDGVVHATPTLVETDLATLRAHRDTVLEEVFGPFAVLVTYPEDTDLGAVVAELFPGELTATVHRGAGEGAQLAGLLATLGRHAGRVLVDGWPTGVAVTPAMQHGGPWPATTSDATSVGTAAIGRFLRGTTYQDAPQDALPAPLQDGNPWGVPQARSGVGESAHW